MASRSSSSALGRHGEIGQFPTRSSLSGAKVARPVRRHLASLSASPSPQGEEAVLVWRVRLTPTSVAWDRARNVAG